jgi:hypothetical protein
VTSTSAARSPTSLRASQSALNTTCRVRARRLLAWFIAAMVFLYFSMRGSRLGEDANAQDARPRIYVYLHTDSKFAALEKTLKEKLPLLTVTVFGRFRDLEDAMQARPPDALVALHALLVTLNVQPALQGVRGNADWEPYVLLSQDLSLDEPLAGKVIGVVDLLGRTGTQDFVAKLLGTDDIKLKRVTKTEDLLPLLQFSAADAVLAPSAAAKDLRDRSRLPLTMRPLPDARVRLAAVGVLNVGAKNLVVSQVLRLDGDTLRTLGVERWRAP